MQVKSRINVTDGRGGRMRPGDIREVPEAWGKSLVAHGRADEVDAAGNVIEQLDRMAPVPKPKRRPTDRPRSKPRAVRDTGPDPDLILDLSTLVDTEMGVDPPEDDAAESRLVNLYE